MEQIRNNKKLYNMCIPVSNIIEYFNQNGNQISCTPAVITNHSEIANAKFYKPIKHSSILSVMRARGSLDCFTRLIGMEGLDYIDFKCKFSKTNLFMQSWILEIKCVDYSNVFQSFPDEDKYDAMAILSVLLKIAYLNTAVSRTEGEEKSVILSYQSLERICALFKWTVSTINFQLLSEIIQYALSLSFPNVKVLVRSITQRAKININRELCISAAMITTLLPDINLFILSNYNITKATVDTSNVSNRSKFIHAQFQPCYKIRSRDMLNKLYVTLPSLITNRDHNKISHTILSPSQISDYNANTWYHILEKQQIKLQYQDTPSYLTITALKQHQELYNQLVSIEDADSFLDYMSQQHKKIFYPPLFMRIGRVSAIDVKKAKEDMFIAFSMGHIVEFLLRCGLVLTEEVFMAIFGLKIDDYSIALLKTGIALQSALHPNKISIINNMHSLQIENGNTILFNQHSQEHRVSLQISLQLLCTYFKGLEKVISIKAPTPTIIKSGSFKCTNVLDTCSDVLEFDTEITLKEYQPQLVNSFVEAVDNPTNESYALHIALKEHRYISINEVRLSLDMPLTCCISNISDMKYFHYFTDGKSINEFKMWVKEKFTNIKDSRLNNILYIAQKVPYSTEDIIYSILKLSIAKRDLIIIGIVLDDSIKAMLKTLMCPNMDATLFDKIYEYVAIIASLEEHKHMRYYVEEKVKKEIVGPMYYDVIPKDAEYYIEDNPPELEITPTSTLKEKLLKIRNNMQEETKEQMGGKKLALKPWVYATKKTLTTSTGLDVSSNNVIETMRLTQGYCLRVKEDINIPSLKHKQNYVITNEDTKYRKVVCKIRHIKQDGSVEIVNKIYRVQCLQPYIPCQESNVPAQTCDKESYTHINKRKDEPTKQTTIPSSLMKSDDKILESTNPNKPFIWDDIAMKQDIIPESNETAILNDVNMSLGITPESNEIPVSSNIDMGLDITTEVLTNADNDSNLGFIKL